MTEGRILLAEDNPANAYLARFLLERHGFSVTHAVNGVECVAHARAEPPDLVLVDLQMPLMDGFDVVRELRAMASTRDIPVIAASAFALAGDRDKALAAGFCEYIEKPFEPTTFAARVAAHVRQSGGGMEKSG
jgi:CheY-like chemotaxis protein